ncbi:GHMP kinase [Cellulomonas chitinilytica]|uniref:GHMP kinase n=1 Tax=Cellulomonas chitinilytica TaxID=398759 RepID=A0A919P1U6_9CELL|nr:hypothetical protein [Cellulomonas chitinilytica]GIG20597.1 GHMP kinase [Cellulomonas chitinilytica]
MSVDVRPPALGAVTTMAPLRVSLAGGGTDLPSYHLGRGGRVLSLAISRYVCVSAFDRTFDGTVTTRFDTVATVGSADGVGNPLARAALERLGRTRDVQVASFADAPSGSGLGSSGAFGVALVHALQGADAVPDDDARARVADLASDLEMVDLERSVGRHDHYMAAFGGIRELVIAPDGRVDPRPVPVPAGFDEFVAERLLLFHVGGVRDASAALSVQDHSTKAGDRSVIGALDAIHELAVEAVALVEAGEFDAIGEVLHRHWLQKRQLSDRVTNSRVDDLYERARAAGATGGKLLGAGGGGFLLVHVPDARGAASVRAAMATLGRRELTFALEPQGTRAAVLRFT